MTDVAERQRLRRVALVYPQAGPITPELWSGTPHGLASGLAELGVEVVPVGYRLPFLLHKGVAVASRVTGRRGDRADRSPVRMLAREQVYARAFAAGGLDAAIAVGTDCYRLDRVPRSVPVASYDDTTLATMWANPDSDLHVQDFAEQDVREWTRVQCRSSRAADVNCVSTAWAARSLVRDYGVPARRVSVVGMGHVPRPARLRRYRDWSRPVFLFLGVEWRRKNGDAVLRAFRTLRRSHPDAVLHLVGQHPSVDEPGVIGHGYLRRGDFEAQVELDAVFREATALVLPSLFDPSPIAYLEAASAGLPVVATSEGGAGELLGEAAITVPPHDDTAILDAMLTLARPAEAERRGAASLQVASTATWRHVAGRILDAVAAFDTDPHHPTLRSAAGGTPASA